MTLTRVTNLQPGDIVDLGPNEIITVREVIPYGERETKVIDLNGNSIIFSNTNWFETL